MPCFGEEAQCAPRIVNEWHKKPGPDGVKQQDAGNGTRWPGN